MRLVQSLLATLRLAKGHAAPRRNANARRPEEAEYVHRATLTAHLQTAVARPMPAWAMSALLEPWTGPSGQRAYYRQIGHYDHDYTARLETLYPQDCRADADPLRRAGLLG